MCKYLCCHLANGNVLTLKMTRRNRTCLRNWRRLIRMPFEHFARSSSLSQDEGSRRRSSRTTSRTWSSSTPPDTSTCSVESRIFKHGLSIIFFNFRRDSDGLPAPAYYPPARTVSTASRCGSVCVFVGLCVPKSFFGRKVRLTSSTSKDWRPKSFTSGWEVPLPSHALQIVLLSPAQRSVVRWFVINIGRLWLSCGFVCLFVC